MEPATQETKCTCALHVHSTLLSVLRGLQSSILADIRALPLLGGLCRGGFPAAVHSFSWSLGGLPVDWLSAVYRRVSVGLGTQNFMHSFIQGMLGEGGDYMVFACFCLVGGVGGDFLAIGYVHVCLIVCSGESGACIH